jgi:hypothetical protein
LHKMGRLGFPALFVQNQRLHKKGVECVGFMGKAPRGSKIGEAAYLWQTLSIAMQELPHGLPLVQ